MISLDFIARVDGRLFTGMDDEIQAALDRDFIWRDGDYWRLTWRGHERLASMRRRRKRPPEPTPLQVEILKALCDGPRPIDEKWDRHTVSILHRMGAIYHTALGWEIDELGLGMLKREPAPLPPGPLSTARMYGKKPAPTVGASMWDQ